MRRRFVLSPEAAADLEDIRHYTSERFGVDQARRYLSGLREAFEQLASYPGSGQDIAAGSEFRCWVHSGHYRVLYRERGDRLEIGRIIHTARGQEFQRALKILLRRP